MSNKILLHILAILIGVAGALLVGFENWRIFMGVWLLIWANNLSQKASETED